MQRVLSSKIMMISLLIVLFLIAFAIIRGTVYERQGNYQRVIQDIARNNVNSQTVLTPFIIVPVTTTFDCPNDKSKICSKRKQVVISPETMEWKNKVEVDDQSFKRGIYRAISYHNQAIMTGRFVLSDKLLSPAANQQVDWSNATMRIYLSDLRGLKSPPVLSINQQKFAFEFPRDEESNPLAATYTHISLHDLSKSNRFDFTVTMDITGTGSLQFLPLGKELSLAMVANWPHPSFFGESLPTKNITSKSFNADWKNTYIANRNSQLLAGCMDANVESCTQLQQAFQRQPSSTTRGEYNQGNVNNLNVAGSFGVSFIQAVDVYLMTDRAIKYAALFLVITFGAFFLFEILKDLRIHPMQYALVGAALAVFSPERLVQGIIRLAQALSLHLANGITQNPGADWHDGIDGNINQVHCVSPVYAGCTGVSRALAITGLSSDALIAPPRASSHFKARSGGQSLEWRS